MSTIIFQTLVNFGDLRKTYIVSETPECRPPDEDSSCSEGESFEDVGSFTYSTIKIHLNVGAAHRVDYLG